MPAEDFIPDRDASLGLVFRLNILWSKADYAALGGRYDEWNFILDRIYCNLLYREEIETVVDEEGKMVKVELSEKDTKIYKCLSLQIAKAKREHKNAKTEREKARTRSIWYHALQKKDIWLRKFMQKLKLYLKETEKKPGSVLFGDFGKAKRGY